MQLTLRIPGRDMTKALVGQLDGLAPERRALLIEALGSRRDPLARDAIAKHLTDENEAVKLAAIAALAQVGDASSVEPLAQIAAREKGTVQRTARDCLARLSAPAVDERILASAGKGDANVRAELIRAVLAWAKQLLAKRAPAMRLVCYLDCGPDMADGKTPKLQVVRGQPYVWPDCENHADTRFGTIVFDGRQVEVEATGLDPKKDYQVGFTWWDYDHDARTQSVWAAPQGVKDWRKVPDPTKLPSLSARREHPQERTLAIPADLYPDGAMRLAFRKEGGVNAVLSGAWLWESDTPQPPVPAPKGLEDDEAMDLMKRSYEQIIEVAEAYEITINIEAHGYFTTNPDRMEQMLAFCDSPCLRMNMDTGNTFIAGQDPVAFARRFLDKITHVHVKDVSESLAAAARGEQTGIAVSQCAIGDGVNADSIRQALALLRDHGYDGVLSMECEGQGGPMIEKSLAWLRGTLAELKIPVGE